MHFNNGPKNTLGLTKIKLLHNTTPKLQSSNSTKMYTYCYKKTSGKKLTFKLNSEKNEVY